MVILSVINACGPSKEIHRNAFFNFFHSPKSNCTTQGNRIAVKGCSVQHLVKILRAFGVEIKEDETTFKRKQTKMVSVDGIEPNIKVVRGMYTVLGHTLLCCIQSTYFAISFFAIASQQIIEITSCVCVGTSEEQIIHRMARWETYCAILWELKLHGARGWLFLKELCIQNSPPKV